MKRTARLPAFVLTTVFVLTTAFALTSPAAAQEPSEADRETARRALTASPVFDGHNDLPWAIRENEDAPRVVPAYDLREETSGQTDIARLRAGMVGAQFWSVYVPAWSAENGAARVQLEQIDIAKQIFDAYPEAFEEAGTAEDVRRIMAAGKIASVMGMEGGHAIENSLGALRSFHRMGVRYMTLTHGANVDWADSGTDEPVHGGLTRFGEEVVREMNRLGMLVDLSHTSVETMYDVLDVTEAPVIYSHSSARAVTDHPRNVPDDVLRRLPDNGGVVMVTFVQSFVNSAVNEYRSMPQVERPPQRPRATLSDVADHIDHIRQVAGVDHVGIGSDFDGMGPGPVGLDDVSTYPALFAELARRGWTEEELRKLASENVLRAWEEAGRVAQRLQRERAPSVATIEELDGPPDEP
jgi:membrane dipeptidase